MVLVLRQTEAVMRLLSDGDSNEDGGDNTSGEADFIAVLVIDVVIGRGISSLDEA